jgi:hypothetical protein
MPRTADFQREIDAVLVQAENEGKTEIVIAAREIHTRLGGYVEGQRSNHRMAPLSRVLLRMKRDGDEVLEGSPAQGKGANLRIRFLLPRPVDENTSKIPAVDQHALALQALPIIGELARRGEVTRYGDLAVKLGRPQSNARAVAQACNLLDSAATHARRPLMALWTVRDVRGLINSKAWKTDTVPELREAIIEEASQHRFTQEDEDAIASSMVALRGMGAQKAWERMKVEVPHADMMARLMDREPPTAGDSLNDLDAPGSDAPHTVASNGRRYVRDPRVRAEVLQRAGGCCEHCGNQGFVTVSGGRYLEAHHILALSEDGKDRRSNVIALCAEDHRRAHFAPDRKALNSAMSAKVARLEAEAVT